MHLCIFMFHAAHSQLGKVTRLVAASVAPLHSHTRHAPLTPESFLLSHQPTFRGIFKHFWSLPSPIGSKCLNSIWRKWCMSALIDVEAGEGWRWRDRRGVRGRFSGSGGPTREMQGERVRDKESWRVTVTRRSRMHTGTYDIYIYIWQKRIVMWCKTHMKSSGVHRSPQHGCTDRRDLTTHTTGIIKRKSTRVPLTSRNGNAHDRAAYSQNNDGIKPRHMWNYSNSHMAAHTDSLVS